MQVAHREQNVKTNVFSSLVRETCRVELSSTMVPLMCDKMHSIASANVHTDHFHVCGDAALLSMADYARDATGSQFESACFSERTWPLPTRGRDHPPHLHVALALSPIHPRVLSMNKCHPPE